MDDNTRAYRSSVAGRLLWSGPRGKAAWLDQDSEDEWWR